jgi:pyruvate,water dikinase
MTCVVQFDDSGAVDLALVGGKGANLGRLTRAGFRVPPGFTVSTAGYWAFLDQTGLAENVSGLVGSIDFDDPGSVEKITAEIRGLMHAADCPGIVADDLATAYRGLGTETRVAVRSSGTAEDLDDASFAGQHDTYLHVQGLESVVDALKRCWASLWTARAAAYRHHKCFDEEGIGIAVVVQKMVDAEVSGVMFTANPITVVTNEIAINASWGLGEAVVSGMVTPDAYILDLETLRLKDKRLGTKELCVRLDEEAGHGTVTESVPASEREVFSLADDRVAELGELGRRVMASYDDLPQDIEWALADDVFYLLQARPVTGAPFSWDETIGDWESAPSAEDTLWSRVLSDDGWTGAVSPLFYSCRGLAYARGCRMTWQLMGNEDVARLNYMRYYRATVYWNTDIDKAFVTKVVPPRLRPMALSLVSPFDHDEILKAPYSYLDLMRILARVQGLAPQYGVNRWVKTQQDYIDNRREEAAGKPDAELRLFSDEALIAYTEGRIDFEARYVQDLYVGYFLHWQLAARLLAEVVAAWYDGDNATVLLDLLTGTERQTFTVKENLELWNLSRELRASQELAELFRSSQPAEFFARLPESEAGRVFLAQYEPFLQTYGHRGHSDRDLFFTRRAEDPAVDYRLIGAFLNVDDSVDPAAIEAVALRRKQVAFDEIVTNLKKKPLGMLKAEIFKILNAYNQRLLIGRDDERGFVDISTYTIKRCFLEISRRLTERGVFEDQSDVFFLSKEELYDVARGRANMPLSRAKISGRRHNFNLVNTKERQSPTYLQHHRPLEVATGTDEDATILSGVPTSGGLITATARIVRSLEEISRVRQGEIMVCNSTDPGWTPVFLLLAGAVFETGGALAHCSCISREYGIPAVQVIGALHRIPDGATITLNGNTGVVTIVDAPELFDTTARTNA